MDKLRQFSYTEKDRVVAFKEGSPACRGEATISSIESNSLENGAKEISVFVSNEEGSEALWKKITLTLVTVGVEEFNWKKQIGCEE